jgi:hypothetical protein
VRRCGLSVPPAFSKALVTEAKRIAGANLAAVHTSMRLSGIFAGRGIDHRFLKGVSLGQQLYGHHGIKESVDLDILVLPEAVPATIGLLRDFGHTRVRPVAGNANLTGWMDHVREASFLGNGVTIDLHWRLSDDPALLAGLDAECPVRHVQFGSRSLPTMCAEDDLAYLAFHGAEHAWSRLKWLADFAALVRRLEADELARALARAEALGVGHAAGSALMIAEALLGTPLPQPLIASMRARRSDRLLVCCALGSLSGSAEVAEDRPGNWRNLYHQAALLLIRPTTRSILRRLWLAFANAEDRVTNRFPGLLRWLYPVAVIGRSTGRKLGALLRR